MALSIMVDLETLALEDDALIPQIAAVVFDTKTFEVYGEFCECINILDLKKKGFSINKETMQWWSEQDADIRKSVMNGKKTGDEVAKEFDEFLNYHFEGINFDIWANGILFDVPKTDYFMLFHDYAPLTMRTRYNRVQDFRTLRNQIRNKHRKELTKLEDEINKGSQHNALDDCHWQLESLKLCLSLL